MREFSKILKCGLINICSWLGVFDLKKRGWYCHYSVSNLERSSSGESGSGEWDDTDDDDIAWTKSNGKTTIDAGAVIKTNLNWFEVFINFKHENNWTTKRVKGLAHGHMD